MAVASSHRTASATGGAPVAALVGRTPLVRLRPFEAKPGVEIYAKLESHNPGGSVKDRAALAMILAGEKSGALHPGRALLDATSGNTGIAYAMLAAERGYRVRLCLPGNVTPERKRLLHAYGAELVLTDPMEGSDGAILEARRIYERTPDAFFYADQYNNPANWRAHYDTTAVEVLEQCVGRVTHFVAGLGTGGTFIGTGRRLRGWRPSVRLVSVQPESPLHGIEGLKHMASAIVPGIYDPGVADTDIPVATEDAHDLVRRLAREMGLLVGPSSGAALAACLHLATSVDRAVIVTIFPDGGARYLSEPFWDESGLHLSDPVELAIRRHAVAAYPEECCGALLGPGGASVDEAFPLENTTSGERRRRFVVSADDYRQAEARATAVGREIVGFYHSHPDHPAVPSQFDLDHAWPNLSYVIVSVRNGRDEHLRSWRLRADRTAFEEERVTRAG